MYETQTPLNVQQAAEYLNFKPSYIYSLVHFGKLPAYKPAGKKLLFKMSDLENFAYGNKVGGRSEKSEEILNATQKKKALKNKG